jgi:hypothetical protein
LKALTIKARIGLCECFTTWQSSSAIVQALVAIGTKVLAVTARMTQCHVFPRERLLLQDDEDSVLRTEAVSEKG